jgi:hypothetical protein
LPSRDTSVKFVSNCTCMVADPSGSTRASMIRMAPITMSRTAESGALASAARTCETR